jgi:hypothetical protein
MHFAPAQSFTAGLFRRLTATELIVHKLYKMFDLYNYFV